MVNSEARLGYGKMMALLFARDVWTVEDFRIEVLNEARRTWASALLETSDHDVLE